MTNRVHQGHLARKRFGQNFLNDQFVIESIVSAINPQKAGRWSKSARPCRTDRAGRRTPRRTDRHRTGPRSGRTPANAPVPRAEADHLSAGRHDHELRRTVRKMGQPLRVFGNLPYNISTPLMFHLFSYTDAIADMHFMLQKRWLTARCRPEQ